MIKVMDCAQGNGFTIAGSAVVAKGGVQEVPIGAGEYQTFLLFDRVHYGLTLLPARVWVNGLKIDVVHALVRQVSSQDGQIIGE